MDGERARRLARYAGWWLAALAVAVFVSWQGVLVVATQVTEARPAPLTPEQARRARARPPASPDSRPEAPPSPPVTVSPEEPAVTDPGGTPVLPPPGSPEGAPEEPRQETSSTTTTTTGTATSTTSTLPTTTSSGPESEIRTYRVTGGSVALRFSPSGVTVVWANPEPGFEVTIEEAHGNGVAVTFESASWRSVVEGWWDDGPRDRVQEEPAGPSGQ